MSCLSSPDGKRRKEKSLGPEPDLEIRRSGSKLKKSTSSPDVTNSRASLQSSGSVKSDLSERARLRLEADHRLLCEPTDSASDLGAFEALLLRDSHLALTVLACCLSLRSAHVMLLQIGYSLPVGVPNDPHVTAILRLFDNKAVPLIRYAPVQGAHSKTSHVLAGTLFALSCPKLPLVHFSVPRPSLRRFCRCTADVLVCAVASHSWWLTVAYYRQRLP
jgi:hypothetical protein